MPCGAIQMSPPLWSRGRVADSRLCDCVRCCSLPIELKSRNSLHMQLDVEHDNEKDDQELYAVYRWAVKERALFDCLGCVRITPSLRHQIMIGRTDVCRNASLPGKAMLWIALISDLMVMWFLDNVHCSHSSALVFVSLFCLA